MPRANSSSACVAALRACSCATVMKALSRPFSRSKRARAASTTSRDDTTRDSIRLARSTRPSSHKSAPVMFAAPVGVGLDRKRWPWHTLGEGFEFSQSLVEIFELGDNRLDVDRRKAQPFEQP